jgi:2-polyprenyl-6-methoxyphenol hydroxylase-like FAD-dependent oxidoreductase
MPDEQVPVLIVGGSLVGLTTAMLLGHYGVPSLSVERHAGTAIHPRAGHFQLRTMELLRQLGLEARVREKSLETYSPTGGIVAAEWVGLVRPDGVVAWRSRGPASRDDVERALEL